MPFLAIHLKSERISPFWVGGYAPFYAAAVECIPIISRMIHDGFNGYLAEPENPQSLAQAMISSSKIEVVIPIYKSSSKEDFISVFKE